MAERKLVDATEALQFTADNGGVYTLKVTNDGQLYFANGSGVAPSSDAVAMWKASNYTSGAEYLKDLTGKGHHLRLGSTGKAQIIGGSFQAPGATGNYVSTPDTAAHHITGDIDIRAKFMTPNLGNGVEQSIVSRWATPDNSYMLAITSAGNLRLYWYDGTTNRNVVSSVVSPYGNGQTYWARATLVVNNGAGGHTATFYTSTDGQSWTQLGTTQSAGAFTTSISAGTSALTVGTVSGGTGQPLKGQVFYAEVRSGVNGNVVAIFDPSAQADVATSWTSPTGEVWTVTGTSGADTNDPLYLPYTGIKHIYLPGVADNYPWVPDVPNLRLTGDLDIRVDVALDDWTPPTRQMLIAKYGGSGNRGYGLEIDTAGKISTSTSSNGTADAGSGTSSVATGLADGARKTIRWTLDADNGSGGRDSKFYLGDSVNGPWTQLGSTVTIGSTISIYPSTANLSIGGMPFGGFGTQFEVSGKVYRIQIYASRDGSNKVLDTDFTSTTSGPAATSATFTCATGQTVTINRSTSGRKAVVVDRPLFLFGSDDYMETADTDDLDIGSSDSLTMVAVFRKNGTQGTVHGILAKQGIADAPSYSLLVRSGRQPKAWAHNGTSYIEATSSDYTDYQPTIVVGRLNRASNQMTLFVNGVAGTPLSFTGSMSNNMPLRIGTFSDVGSPYAADMEFIGAAVWRRALSDAEISYLAGEFGV